MQPLSVLIAEDNLINQTVLSRFLTKQGHKVSIAENGQLAVEQWRNGGFDIILMDIMMPEMDGIEATRQIRAAERESGGHIPILAVTANAMQGDRERCLEAGMDGFMAKPVQLDRLLVMIEEALSPGNTDADSPH